MASVQRHQQVGLLGLGGHPGGGARALHIDHDHRELQRHGEPDRLHLEIHPGPAGSSHPEAPAEGGAERHPRRRDLILGLDRAHAEAGMTGELVQELRRRRDRVAREQQGQVATHAGGDQAERQRGRPVHVAVSTGRDVGRGLDPVLDVEQLGRLAERPAGVESGQVRFQDCRIASELLLDPPFGHVGGAAVQPREQTQREEVLRTSGVARGGVLDLLDAPRGQGGHGDPVDAIALERPVLERV